MARKKIKLLLPLPNKLAIYIRVSTQQQAKEGISSLDQKMRGEAKARELGWDFEIYDDSGISGTKGVEDRKGLLRLLNDVEDRKIGGMYSVDIDRWSRDDKYEEPQLIISKLKEAGIKIFFPGGEFNLHDHNIELMGRIKGIFASYESLQTKARVKRGLERSMTEGKNAGGGAMVAYGYDRINKVLVVNDDEANVVKNIFELYINGMGTFAIASHLNDRRIPTKRNKTKAGNMRIGKKHEVINQDTGIIFEDKHIKEAKDFKWRDSVILNILKNPIYKGEKRFNELSIPCPAIIEPSIFDSVQLLFAERKKFKTPPNSQNPFSITRNKFLLKGLVVCAKCGRSFYGKLRADLKDKAYVCLSQRNKNEFCGNRGIDIDFLNNLVWQQTLNIESEVIKFFDRFKGDQSEYPQGWGPDVESNLRNANEQQEKIEELLKLKLKLLRNFNEEKINERDFNTLNSEYDNELIEAEASKEDSERQLTVYRNKDILIKSIKDYVARIDSVNATFEEKQSFIRSFVKQVRVFRGYADGRLYFPDTNQVFIEYKFNNLTNLKLTSKIDVGYKKNGQRTGEISQEITVEQYFFKADEQGKFGMVGYVDGN